MPRLVTTRVDAAGRAVHPPVVHPDDDCAAEAGVLSAGLARQHADVRRRLRAGAWRSYGGVVVMHNGALTPVQADWVAVLRCGTGAVLAATSAMRWAGVRLEAPAQPQVVVPAWRSSPSAPGVHVRRSRLLGVAEVHPIRQPPTLRLPRATLDAGSLERRPDSVRRLLSAPVQQRLLAVPELRAALLRLGPHPGRSLMLRTLDDLERGAHGEHEQRFARIVRSAGLPPPVHQALRSTPDGRRYLDAAWPQYGVHAEVDGLAHMRVEQWLADLHRSNELEILGSERRLRFPTHALVEHPAEVADQVRRALLAGGWRP